MKRSVELRPLSEDHHHGLVASRRLRLLAEGEAPAEPGVAAFLEAWASEIEPHFRAEEEVLLPELERAGEGPRALAERTRREHAELRAEVRRLETTRDRPAAARVAARLHDHIRFEERELFPAAEEAIAPEALARIGRALQARPDRPHRPPGRARGKGR